VIRGETVADQDDESEEWDDTSEEEVEAAVTALSTGKATIDDYVSGLPVRATPEEIEAVQVFSRRLVEDYGYPKSEFKLALSSEFDGPLPMRGRRTP
jgi:hypothetical protein